MKKLFLLPFVLIFALFSCGREVAPPREKLAEFVSAYGAEGIIYHSEAEEGDEGYLSADLASLAFSNRELPQSYAILLNVHLDAAYECGLFLMDGNRAELLEVCLIRTSILDPQGERTFIAIYGNYVFYSTLSDPHRAKSIADKVFS